MTRKMTARQLEKLGRSWQQDLRLLDWEVSFSFVPAYSDLLPESHANCHSHVETKKAVITLIAPDVYADEIHPEYDVELKVVHELLHLHFEPLGDVPELALEQAIEALARTLVSLKRRKKKK